jgi:antitoxin component YwqK of YwqJK toxin-antitoxin module
MEANKHFLYLLAFLLLFAFSPVKAQDSVAEFWIYDTSKVLCFYASAAIIPDTIAKLKNGLDSLTEGKRVIIYWDREKKHKYQELSPTGKNNYITYYRNGQLNEEFLNYDSSGNRIEHYMWRAFYPDGKKKGEQIFEGDKRTTLYYFQNGQIKQKDVSVINDKGRRFFVYVYYESYCENGQLASKDSIGSEQKRAIITYHCNGKMKRRYYNNGKGVETKWQEWHENGKLSIDGTYQDLLIDCKYGKCWKTTEQGIWKYYNEKGELIMEKVYKDGEIISIKEYKSK